MKKKSIIIGVVSLVTITSINAQMAFCIPTLAVNSANDPTINFTVIPAVNPPSPGSTVYWWFGDGSSITTTALTISHTYTANGTYWVCAAVIDSVSCMSYTADCQSVQVNNAGSPPPSSPLSCNTISFTAWADTANSQIWYYNYTPIPPTGGVPPYTIIGYLWSFGDGNYSTQAYPSYTYAVPGTYTVCLYITYQDANNDTCTSTSCIQINRLMDGSNPDYILNNAKYLYPDLTIPTSEGFTNVNAITKLYPNPFSDEIHLILANKMSGYAYITDLLGRVIKQFTITNSNQMTLSLSDIEKGTYILILDNINNKRLFTQTVIKN